MAEAATTSSGIPGRKLLVGMLVVFVCAVVPAVFVPTLMCRAPDPELPDLGAVPKFSLVDERGMTFTEEALRGHPTIIDFVFTRCDQICPTLSGRLERLQERTGDKQGSAIKLLSISIDPAYDTPERLAEYARRFNANPTRWRFVTGPKDLITALVTGPLMTVMDDNGKSPSGAPAILHRGYFMLVDASLVIRGIYDSNDDQKLDDLVHHARFLARQSDERSYKFGE